MVKLLEGIKILDLTRYFPGPFATLRLLDRGADVIKVEDPNGDPARGLGCVEGIEGKEGVVFRTMARGKKSVSMNLKDPDELQRFYRLAKKVDVVVESFRPGIAKKLGIDYETLYKLNPNLVYVSISGYGQTGPYSKLGGHDLNYMAMSGLLDQFLDKNGDVITPQIALDDLIVGYAASEAILAGLVSREINGKGCYQDVSMVDAAMSMMGLHVMYQSAGGGEHGMNDNGIGYGIFKTRDDRHIALCAMEDKFFYNFCTNTGNEDLLPYHHTPVTPDNPYVKQIADTIAAQDFDYWVGFGKRVDCCMTPVLHTGELANSDYAKSRGMIEHKWGLNYVSTTYTEGESFVPDDKPYSAVGEENYLCK